MKKILVVDFNGTTSVYTHYFAQGLKENNDVKILGKKKMFFLDFFKNLNVYLGFNTGVKFLDYILNWIWLLFNYKKFDIIVIQWLQLLKYTSIEVEFIKFFQKRVKLVYILHNLYPHNNTNPKIINRYNKLYKFCKNIAVHTYEMKSDLKKINPKINILKIQHGYFFDEFREQTSLLQENKCLMIGQILRYKGIEDALKVVKILKEKNTIIHLKIMGLADQNYLIELNKIIDDFNIGNQVTIIPEIVPTAVFINEINKSTMLWLPYKKISQSGISYTSIGLGKPFVGYNVGNFKSFFGDKGLANIVEKDNVIHFSEAVLEVLKNKQVYYKRIDEHAALNLWEANRVILN
ncbi:glycosyltransferase [Polaribacter sp. Hel_I_88]|uniref:glycosyltransferase n=1 Tax=Polaribacter sp. Hel_I_88 TaxID=1250006 RepID=UPI00047A981C|nr:glycosyltransferase [Polaribacter sp. Hel_I_88]